MISNVRRFEHIGGSGRKVVHPPRSPAAILARNLLLVLTVVAAPLLIVVPIVQQYRLARSTARKAFQNGTAAMCFVGEGGGRGSWFPTVDAFPARAFDACTMNDFRNIEQKPCIQHCYHQHDKDDSRKKRALFDSEALSGGGSSKSALGDQQQVVFQYDEQQKPDKVFDGPGQHLWQTLMDEIKRARLLLAESQSRMQKQLDLVASTTLSPIDQKYWKSHKQLDTPRVAASLEQAAELLRHDFKRGAAADEELRFRRSNSPECLSCFIDVVQHFNKCT